jgi:hypothetical protein
MLVLAFRPLIRWARVECETLYAAAVAHILLNWPFWYALTASNMRSSNLTVESVCFDAILDGNLDLMVIWWLQGFRG